MENASKALIIAGAILLAILLISLGIYIFTGAQDTVKNSGLSEQEVSTFNSAILKYEGNKRSASDVRAVKNEAVVANKKLTSEGAADEDKIKINNAAANQFETSGLSDSDRNYKIKLGYSATTGRINSITIEGKGIGE